MYKGNRYSVSCSVLGAPPTKDGSYQAANAWWLAKRAELDLAAKPAARLFSPTEQAALATWGISWPAQADLPAGGADVSLHILARLGQMLTSVELTPDRPLAPELAAVLGADRVRQLQEAGATLRGERTDPGSTTVGALADAWVKRQESQVRAGTLAPARLAATRSGLKRFVEFVGVGSDARQINAAALDGYHAHLLGHLRSADRPDGMARSYALDVFNAAKAFTRWAASVDAIPLPKNIGRRFSFGPLARPVEVWSAEEVQRALAAARPRLRLAMLLALNVGAYAKDCADLRDDEIDWRAGTLTRVRSKAKGYDNPLTVTYRLWPGTFDLLKELRSGGERVLQNAAGRSPVVTALHPDGRLSRTDSIGASFCRLRARARLPGRRFKELRKTAATLLASCPEHARYVETFLGHTPSGTAARHYVRPDPEGFDRAVLWLGRQLGQVPG
jgi:integrase